MKMAKGSSLNPLASTFIPSNVVESATEVDVINSDPEVFVTKPILLTSMAIDFSNKVLKYKKERGEDTITKREVMNLVLRLIAYHYNIRSTRGLMRAAEYLEYTLPTEPMVIEANGKSLTCCKLNRRKFDFSVYRIPAQKILLVAFYGLYSHEQAFRPLLSLPRRPETLKNDIWSVTDKDLKLWNQSVVQPCGCPPMFGYHIPADFFGNPFKLSNKCSKNRIHLSRSRNSAKGNDYILLEHALDNPTGTDTVNEEELPLDTKPVNEEELPLDTKPVNEEELPQDTKPDLDNYSKEMKNIVKSICYMIDTFDTVKNGSDNWNSPWNTSVYKPDIPKIDELLDRHNLLDDEPVPEEPVKEIPIEVKDLLRKGFSVSSSSCNPPCSAWCPEQETPTIKNERESHSSVIDLLNETTQLLTDISSGSETIWHPPTTQPTLHPKPIFKRSFSANDSDKWQTCTISKVSRPDSFTNRRESYDSGIMSSNEDEFCEDSEEGSSDKAPMWSLFSGEHSLWQPLPIPEQSKSTHRRVRDLKRQTSSVN